MLTLTNMKMQFPLLQLINSESLVITVNSMKILEARPAITRTSMIPSHHNRTTYTRSSNKDTNMPCISLMHKENLSNIEPHRGNSIHES
jgi:hypothetical protein